MILKYYSAINGMSVQQNTHDPLEAALYFHALYLLNNSTKILFITIGNITIISNS